MKRDLKAVFGRYASPVCIAVGLISGLIYAWLVYQSDGFAARLALAVSFATAGPMGMIYFESQAMKSRYVPWLTEILRLFFAMWTLVGVVYFIRAFADAPLPDSGLASVLVYLFVGMVSGTVWMLSLSLLIGLRLDIGSWPVVRFPVWIWDFFAWLRKLFRGRE